MKSLTRRAEAPRKLQERQKKHSNGPGNLSSAKLWKRFRRSSARKETIEALMEMQGAYCAYCEDQISEGNRHIDHFYPKSLYQEKIFDWDNLFLSCGNDHSTHCVGMVKEIKILSISLNLIGIIPQTILPTMPVVKCLQEKISLKRCKREQKT